MKKFLLAFFVFTGTASVNVSAQYVEKFTTTVVGSVPTGWTVAANTDVSVYQRPGTCTVNDRGLQTPGVGKNAPTGFVLPILTYSATSNDISLQFSVFIFDANLKCATAKDFPCPTFVKAYLVPTSWNDPLGTPTTPSGAPKPTDYYAAQANYQVLYANTSNTIIFTNVSLPAGVTNYRVLLNFKTADGSNCASGGTKFVFDDFGASSANCNNCAPIANADYFNSDAQNLFANGATSFSGNLYGGYALWANQAPTGFGVSSLTYAPALSNGTDYDLNNTNLSSAKFLPASPLVVETAVTGCANPLPGTLALNQNGTFTYTKGSACVTRVSFTYTLTTYASGLTNPYGTTGATKVTIDLPGQQIVLPVHFKSFTAVRKDNNKVGLAWTTATEQHNRGFYVQRSTGNSPWKDVAFVFSQAPDGNSSAELSYALTDINTGKGAARYRILQVDLDGSGHYSETRSVRGSSSAAGRLLLFPNPSTTGTVTFVFDSESAKDITVSDALGRTVKQYRNLTAGSLEIKNLAGGLYTVRVRDAAAGTTSVDKFVIAK